MLLLGSYTRASVHCVTLTSDIMHVLMHMDHVQTMTVRVDCNDEARARRGWIYEAKKDESPTETEMDDFSFDLRFDNSQDGTGAINRWCNDRFLVGAMGAGVVYY